MQHLIKRLIPFILLGIGLVAFVLGIMLFAYLFIFGALVGITLFMISWIREKFFPSKKIDGRHQKKSGRIIDSDEWKKS